MIFWTKLKILLAIVALALISLIGASEITGRPPHRYAGVSGVLFLFTMAISFVVQAMESRQKHSRQ